ncbi:DNA methyltransferase [Acinetobacter rathckeae]|uniref:DNA methyltransferase n=1 Tax=Acinetobacter rathckeae TaxID=2605272 RepID=UPI0018A2D4D3|nr:DNA methyltransferase [Acinetobacter rathckeae]MBF7695101.1 class I SAM-dependent DNA methyltransferase [Acinetobacter rathckeae]
MNIIQIEENVKQLIHKIAQDEINKQDFIYELLLAYGHRSQSIGRVRNGERNLAEDKENSVFWKRQIYFKIAKQHDLHSLIDQMKNEKRTESSKIRFLIVTDFKTLLAVDTKTQDTLDVPFSNLAKKFDFFLPWAGMEKAVYQGENPADVKAAEKLAKLFDEIKADNFDEDDLNNKENLHQLNIFLSRLLFCYFAEDTEIFQDKQFISAISKSNENGSDLSSLISRLFTVLNQSVENRETDLPDYLADFPYVNGGLFKEDIQVPKFTRKSRRILIECGAELDWSDINPDIFGSMFQAVVHTEQRSTMGQHYTSVPNIMKVIEPLFLNDLYEELEKNQDSVNKLLKLQQRLEQLKIFDPACGSGNFLIIAYKELRKFEMELLKRIQELELEKTGQFSKPFSVIQVSQFYGIEIDDFAHEVAVLSLWLAEHQMNLIFETELGNKIASLPLKRSGNIISENALCTNWEEFCKNDGLTYILGNPPYVGARNQSNEQKKEMEYIYNGSKEYKDSDYISCWFIKASDYIKDSNSCFGFVSTSSISQGEQVSYLWPKIFSNNQTIFFAYQPFKWVNNAKNNAGVVCVIIGIRDNRSFPNDKVLFTNYSILKVKNISPYLTEGKNTIIYGENKNLSGLPKMVLGNMARDGGNLILNNEEYLVLIKKYNNINKLFRRLYGSKEFIRGEVRWCLWINDEDLELAESIPEIKDRIKNVYNFRMESKAKTTNQYAKIPHKFAQRSSEESNAIIIPRVSSERREYIPIGFLSKDSIISDSAIALYNAKVYMFCFLHSKLHNIWVKAVGGYLGTSIRYSVAMCFNTFLFPKITAENIDKLNELAFNIMSVREKYSIKSMADLYDPDNMPDDLRVAHKLNDDYVECLYRKKRFEDDQERLAYLISIYEKSKNL